MSFDLAALQADACTAQDALRQVDRDLMDPEVDKSLLPSLLKTRAILQSASQDMKGNLETLDNLIGEVMDDYSVTVEGFGTVKRHPKVSRRDWQSEDLLRLVLDSRMVDEETGEVESQVAALKKVYGLKGYNARLTELRKREIQVDEFCSEERRGWTLELRGGT